jgi:energy-coupling factor transport system substrate-specific component
MKTDRTQSRTQGSTQSRTTRLTGKDLITTGIFTVLFSIIMLLFSLTFGMVPLLYPFLVPAALVVGGIVWTYVRVKVPKRFSILIMCTVFALLMFLAGTGWFIFVGILAGGIVAEILSGLGRYRSFIWNTAGYAAFGLGTNLGTFAIVLVARDYYYEYCVANGMDVAWMETFMNFMSWQTLALSSALTIIAAIVGMWLGRLFLRKHFVKAGMA